LESSVAFIFKANRPEEVTTLLKMLGSEDQEFEPIDKA
jgi:hypothetical protein